MKPITVRIQQLSGNGEVWREFTQYAGNSTQVELMLDRIQRSYNMDHTRVLVNDEEVS